jgi:glycosyltransferase involved in cell wall biosynthesis
VEKYKSLLHIIYLKQENNQGPGAARERGLQWCFDNNIEFIMFLDSDDLLLPKAVERLTKEINVTNCDIIISDI